MARIIKKGIDLETEYYHHRERTKKGLQVCGVGIAVVLVSWLLFSLTHIGVFAVLLFPALVCCAGGFLYATSEQREVNILRTGLDGERTAVALVSSLPDTYTVFQSLKVTYEGKSSEMDIVIVGPTGVFVIEVKNLNGTIRGDHEERYWTQHKIGRGGTPYQNSLYSPVKQVRTHVYGLAGILRGAGARVFVNDGVFFTNPETEVLLSGDTARTPVFVISQNGAEELYHYLTDRPATLSDEDCHRINAVLEAL